jgi:phenylalanyl-tRNA synthetase alpha chain
MKEKIESLAAGAREEFRTATSSENLYQIKVKFLGKNGSLSALMKDMAGLSKADKPLIGQAMNEAKQSMEAAYATREREIKDAELLKRLREETLDVTLPGPVVPAGTQHPISMVMDEMVQIFSRLGYSMRTGPMIELDRYNFEALNIPADHPARDMQDTFYIDERHVLRTQTSPIQVRTLEKESLPLRILGPGAVFRCDSDISHAPMFHQMEGMLVDRHVSMADLKGTLAFFAREFFGQSVKTRFRPSFFPFTEPSAEVDCSCTICDAKGCRMCSHTGWVEMGGCGLVNPNVFRESGIDPAQWQGFAFGMGIERLAIMKYGIEDIRLFVENDVRFLEQFKL